MAGQAVRDAEVLQSLTDSWRNDPGLPLRIPAHPERHPPARRSWDRVSFSHWSSQHLHGGCEGTRDAAGSMNDGASAWCSVGSQLCCSLTQPEGTGDRWLRSGRSCRARAARFRWRDKLMEPLEVCLSSGGATGTEGEGDTRQFKHRETHVYDTRRYIPG